MHVTNISSYNVIYQCENVTLLYGFLAVLMSLNSIGTIYCKCVLILHNVESICVCAY